MASGRLAIVSMLVPCKRDSQAAFCWRVCFRRGGSCSGSGSDSSEALPDAAIAASASAPRGSRARREPAGGSASFGAAADSVATGARGNLLNALRSAAKRRRTDARVPAIGHHLLSKHVLAPWPCFASPSKTAMLHNSGLSLVCRGLFKVACSLSRLRAQINCSCS